MLVDSFDCRRSTIDPCGSATLLHTQPTVTAGKQSCLELGCRSYCFYCSCSEQGFLWRVGLRLSFIFPARNSLCNLPLALCDELQNWRGDFQKTGHGARGWRLCIGGANMAVCVPVAGNSYCRLVAQNQAILSAVWMVFKSSADNVEYSHTNRPPILLFFT